MCKPETDLKNMPRKILWDFDIKMNHPFRLKDRILL